MAQDNLITLHGAGLHLSPEVGVTYKGSSWGFYGPIRDPHIPIALHAWLHPSPDTASRTDAQQGAGRPRTREQLDFSTPSLGAPGAPRGAYRENAAVRDAKPVKSSGVGGRAAVGLLAGPARAARAPPREAYNPYN
jgi:hypothetical protein